MIEINYFHARYTDFIVQEIGLDGSAAKMSDIIIDPSCISDEIEQEPEKNIKELKERLIDCVGEETTSKIFDLAENPQGELVTTNVNCNKHLVFYFIDDQRQRKEN